MFMIAFRASYKGAKWWFVAAFDKSEEEAANDFAKAFAAGQVVSGEVVCFPWEWN